MKLLSLLLLALLLSSCVVEKSCETVTVVFNETYCDQAIHNIRYDDDGNLSFSGRIVVNCSDGMKLSVRQLMCAEKASALMNDPEFKESVLRVLP